VGCRQRSAKSDLVRVVAVGAGQRAVLLPDPRGRLPGRGAHLHPSEQCLASAVRRKAFARALRLAGPPDASAVEDYLAQRIEEHHAPPTDQLSPRGRIDR
jgi:predicted RNA-binding protein YlxR (DUF448 family)